MSLLFTHSWEHALVAAVIDSAKKDCSSCNLGRTAIQKLVYFLQVLEVPMNYTFRIHHFGPFCDELASSVDWLLADSVVTDEARTPNYSSYATGPNYAEIIASFDNEVRKYRKTINAVVGAMASLDPKELEVAATLDYAFRWVKARGNEGPWKDETVKKFKAIKKNKFADPKIDDWYSRLMSAGLIQA